VTTPTPRDVEKVRLALIEEFGDIYPSIPNGPIVGVMLKLIAAERASLPLRGFELAVTRMGIMNDRMRGCGNHELLEECEAFKLEAKQALEDLRKWKAGETEPRSAE